MERKTDLQIGLTVAASLLTACAQTAEVLTVPSNEGFITPDAVVTPKPKQPIEYLNDDGARVVSEDGKMTVSKGGLSVTLSCAPEHEYVGRMLPPHIDFSTDVEGLNDSRNYWLTVAGPVLAGQVRIDIVSTGTGNQGVRATLHGTHHSIRDFREEYDSESFEKGKPVTVSVYDSPYTNEKPRFGFPVKQVTTLAPDCR